MTIRKRISVLAALSLSFAGILSPAAHAAPTRSITISSQASVKVVPDAVRINATVSSLDTSSKIALANVAKVAAAVRQVLKSANIQTRDISTQNVSIYPEYKYENNTSILTGYRASQSFAIVVRAAASAGDVVDAMVGAGGDNLLLNGATPFVLDNEKATTAARTAAVKSARAKATSYASLLEIKLGKVIYLVENSSPNPYPPTMGLAKTESDATVIDLGEQDVTVSVTVKWSLI